MSKSLMKIDRQEQVAKLKDRVVQLTENLHNLSLELDALERTIEAESRPSQSETLAESETESRPFESEPQPSKVKSPSYSRDFKVNESLEITNSYKGKKGTIGKVVHFTKNQCTIVDRYGVFHTRAKRNFRKSFPKSK